MIICNYLTKEIQMEEKLILWGHELGRTEENRKRKKEKKEELLLTIKSNEETSLINMWISIFEIDTLKKLFWNEYFIKEYPNIKKRLEEVMSILRKIESYDKCFGNFADNSDGKIMDTKYCNYENFLLKDMEEIGLDYFQEKINNNILVDLFNPSASWLFENYCINNGQLKDRYYNGKRVKVEKEGETYETFKSTDRMSHWGEIALKPSAIISVDIQTRGDIKEEFGVSQYELEDDALRFVSLLSDNSVNFTISGVDDWIINARKWLGKEYLDYLCKEIYRTTKEWGIVVWEYFDEHYRLTKAWMKQKKEKDVYTPLFYCYEK